MVLVQRVVLLTLSIRFTGAGAHVFRCLAEGKPPPTPMDAALHALCAHALGRGVDLAVDAEQTTAQGGIDAWTLALQRRYNGLAPTNGVETKEAQPKALVYNTYQAYLRSTPATLSAHLRAAARDRFTLGIKLVRGAYMGSEPRSLIWASKPDTDQAYDGLAAALLQRGWTAPLIPPPQEPDASSTPFPEIRVFVATHNLASATRAWAVQQAQRTAGAPRVPAVYAQVQGMADHVAGALLQAARGAGPGAKEDGPHVAKYLVWGGVRECTAYFVRRAEENRDAVARTGEARRALGRELWLRLTGR